jgi:hypothetical protein
VFESHIGKNLSKQELVNQISMMALNSKEYPLSNGSSIPKVFFQDLENRFSIPASNGMESKAATFCDYFGVEWTSECDSSESPSGGGGTVTRTGLEVLLLAVKRALVKEL